MEIRTILLPLKAEPNDDGALLLAITVARIWGGHIHILLWQHHDELAHPFPGDLLPPSMTCEMLAGAAHEIALRHRRFAMFLDASLAQHQVELLEQQDAPSGRATASVTVAEGRPYDVIAYHARLADVTVVAGRSLAGNRFHSEILQGTLFGSGQLALIAPPQSRYHVGRRICIGWNGTSESASAVRAALPWLRQAVSVRVLSSPFYQRAGPDADALVQYLARHHVQVDQDAFGSVGEDAGLGLLRAAEAYEADLLVIGAYSHPRWRQAVLGGVTRTVLNEAAIPVLMVH